MTDADKLAPYLGIIRQCADACGQPRARVAAWILRESGATWAGPYWPKGDPRGTGDGSTKDKPLSGHGHGLLQIDDRTWGDWLRSHDWGDPLTNIRQGCFILLQTRGYLRSLVSMPGVPDDLFWRTVFAGYNCGPSAARRGLIHHGDPDHFSALGNYSADIWRRSSELVTSVPALGL